MDVREKLVELLEVDLSGSDGYEPELIADYLIANGATVQEWISVDDRLPEEDKAYLVTINHFGGRQGANIRCFAKDGETVDEYELAGQKCVRDFYDSEYGCVSTDSVTHWMPLPAPPKGE